MPCIVTFLFGPHLLYFTQLFLHSPPCELLFGSDRCPICSATFAFNGFACLDVVSRVNPELEPGHIIPWWIIFIARTSYVHSSVISVLVVSPTSLIAVIAVMSIPPRHSILFYSVHTLSKGVNPVRLLSRPASHVKAVHGSSSAPIAKTTHPGKSTN